MKQNYYHYYISLGKIHICICSEIQMNISEDIKEFITDEKIPDAVLYVKFVENLPSFSMEKCGEDILLNYCRDDKYQYAIAKPGLLGPLTMVQYTMDFQESTMYVNEREHPRVVRTLEKVLQLFPIRQLLARYHAMVLHSSQIAVGNKGILFTAPSGTGKSTQAGLWKKYENTPIVCNDRTLLRRNGIIYETYGYPVDGSNPVYSNRKYKLGAIVVLRQGSVNEIQRLKASKALKYLMEQTVLDVWDHNEIISVRTEWLNILEKYPVYLLTCQPEPEAVECLKQQLKKEGVI